jgi:DNA repair photolyase
MIDDELDALARELLAPLVPGASIPGGGELVAISSELGLVLGVRVGGVPVRIDVVPRSGAHAHRVHTEHFAIGHDDGPLAPASALALCRRIAEIVARNEVAVLARVGARVHEGGRVREVNSTRALVPMTSADGPYYALNPYSGCTIGCRFCYAQSRLQPLRALLGLPQAPWGAWVDARIDAPRHLHAELRTLPPAPIKLCPIVADPYQSIERRLRITRACLEHIRAAPQPWPTLLLTRSAHVLDDLELIATLPRAWVGVSLPTVDDEVRAHFEPRAATVAERLGVLRAFRDAGVRTFAVVQPILPGPIDALADALAETSDGAALGGLEGELGASALFDDPRWSHARSDTWQRDALARLRAQLDARGVARWRGELPAEAWA